VDQRRRVVSSRGCDGGWSLVCFLPAVEDVDQVAHRELIVDGRDSLEASPIDDGLDAVVDALGDLPATLAVVEASDDRGGRVVGGGAAEVKERDLGEAGRVPDALEQNTVRQLAQGLELVGRREGGKGDVATDEGGESLVVDVDPVIEDVSISCGDEELVEDLIGPSVLSVGQLVQLHIRDDLRLGL